MHDRTNTAEPLATLEHLTGPSRGTVTWLARPEVSLSIGGDRLVVLAGGPADAAPETVAEFRWAGDTYTISAPAGARIWVNGKQTDHAVLGSGDVLELGEEGPISRFCLAGSTPAHRPAVEEILRDMFLYLRTSRRPVAARFCRSVAIMARRLAIETSFLFRGTILVALGAIGVLLWQQTNRTSALERTVEAGSVRVRGIEADLAKARTEALRPADLARLQTELGRRVGVLEEQTGAVRRVIRRAKGAVVFLQSAYAMRHTASGRFLRHVVRPDGIPVIMPNGRPLLTLEGDGPVAEVKSTGTAFLVSGAGLLVTNRHVVRPWESATSAARLRAQGMEPVIRKFIAYFSGQAGPVEVEVQRVSERHDLAVVKVATVPAGLNGLELAAAAPRAGDEVIVMGYPTGLKSMLAQAGAAFVAELRKTGDTNFWTVAERLAKEGKIDPLASRGIVSRTGGESIMYDAETTHGGSGGPVLDVKGRVVAVNSAILPEFGGANIGVPSDRVKALLEDKK